MSQPKPKKVLKKSTVTVKTIESADMVMKVVQDNKDEEILAKKMCEDDTEIYTETDSTKIYTETDKIKLLYKNYIDILTRNYRVYGINDFIKKEITKYENESVFYDYIKNILMSIYDFKINTLKQIIMTFKFENIPSLLLSNIIVNPYLFVKNGKLITFDKCEKIRIGEELKFDCENSNITSIDIVEAWIYCNIITDSLYIRKNILIDKYAKFKTTFNGTLKNINISTLLLTKKINNVEYCTIDKFYDMELKMTDTVVDLYYEQDQLIFTNLDNMILDYECDNNIKFTELQKKCICSAVKNKFEIICGFPGTGKTTIVRCVLEILCKILNINILNNEIDFKHKLVKPNGICLIAPTGMAVNNLKKNVKTGYLDDMPDDFICTIHKFINRERNKKLLGGTSGIFEELDVISNKLDKINDIIEKDNTQDVSKLLKCQKTLLAKQSNLKKILKEPFIIIIDECSMIDLFMFNYFIKFCNDTDCRLIMLGDINQLPPIGPGSILERFIDSNYFTNNIHYLKDIKRQNGKLKDVILKMNDYLITKSDFDNDTFIFNDIKTIFTSKCDEKEIKSELKQISFNMARTRDLTLLKTLNKKKQDLLLTLSLTDLIKLSDFINKYNLKPSDTQFITCQSSYSAGTDNMNVLLQEIFNPNGIIIHTSNRFLTIPFRVGDTIYRNINDYSEDKLRANGDVGIIISYDTSHADNDKHIVSIKHDNDDIEIVTTKTLYDEFNLGYCKTIHKVQGSQYKNVVIMMPANHTWMWENTGLKLLYTAISRSVNRCYIVGDINVFEKCQLNREYIPRISLFLKESKKYDLL